MPHNKRYQGKARKRFNNKLTDEKLIQNKENVKKMERTRNESERFLFEQKISIKEPHLRFDYSDNLFSLRADYQTRIKVMKIFFPFIVKKTKLKKMENLINNAFQETFLVKKTS